MSGDFLSRPSAHPSNSAARTSTPVTVSSTPSPATPASPPDDLAEALLIRLGAADGGREDVGLVVVGL
ncbi:hypothetical protein ACFQ7I_14045 [Streptomyces massasporeus]